MSESIQEVKARHEKRIMAMEGVVSVGIGLGADGEPAIIVGVDSHRPERRSALPERLDGYPVDVQVIGEVKAQPGPRPEGAKPRQ